MTDLTQARLERDAYLRGRITELEAEVERLKGQILRIESMGAVGFWRDRYEVQHDTLHRMEDELAELRAARDAAEADREALTAVLEQAERDRKETEAKLKESERRANTLAHECQRIDRRDKWELETDLLSARHATEKAKERQTDYINTIVHQRDSLAELLREAEPLLVLTANHRVDLSAQSLAAAREVLAAVRAALTALDPDRGEGE